MFQNAEAYESIMGRWSRRLAPQLIQFGGLRDGNRVLDIGCGTGSLTFLLPDCLPGRRRLQSLIEDKSLDRAFSMLVLHFIPDSVKAVSEMHRVVRPGGTIAAAVWDEYGGLPHYRMLMDIAATLDSSIERRLFLPLTAPGEMEKLWRDLGMLDVEQTSLCIRMKFNSFDDYWRPFTKGEGPPGRLVASLSETMRATLQDHMRRAYIANRPDGPRSFACAAWACRGTVPQ